ncbi:MAG: DNA polymerase III subunit delta [Clostridiales bacterium]|nr:DNA polymerase III subunit delta [Clostridiales bacterium]
MQELKKDIKEKSFKQCYLLYGSEEYLKQTYGSKLLESMLTKEEEMMNLDLFEGNKCSVSAIIDSAETMPFLALKRVVSVKESGLFGGERKADSEKLAVYLNNIPETTCIIFIESSVDRRSKLYKVLEKKGHAVEMKLPRESELVTWTVREAKKRFLTMTSSVSAYFIRSTGGDLQSLVGELEKLAAYKENKGEITIEDIDKVCIKSLETRIFDLVAEIGNRKIEKALEIYHNLLLMKESPIMVLSMIIRQFRLIFQCKVLLEEGKTVKEIAERTGQRDFVIRECVRQASNFTVPSLEQALERCLETDLGVKTGKISQELAVELLILSYSRRQ